MRAGNRVVVCLALACAWLGCDNPDRSAKAGEDAHGPIETLPQEGGADDKPDADEPRAEGGVPNRADAGLPAVRILRGDPAQQAWWDLTIRGVGLSAHEGRWVSVRVGELDRPPERVAVGLARVIGGTFELAFPQVWEPGLYKLKLVHIDVNDDGRCDSADFIYRDARAARQLTLIVRDPPGADVDGLRLSSRPPAEDCALLEAAWPDG
jgi:hypothetical protein